MSASPSLFRNIVRGTSLYLAAILATRVASIFLLPITTRFLTTAEYGALDLIEQVNIVISLLLGGGFAGGFSFFYFENPSPESRRRVVGTALLGAFLIGLVSGLLGFVFARQISVAVFGVDRYANYLRFPLAAMPLNFLLEAVFSWLRIEDRAGTFVIFTFVRIAVVSAGTVLLLAYFHMGMLGVLWTTAGSVMLLGVAATLYCVRKAHPRFSLDLFRRILRYSLPLGTSGIALFFIHFGDRFILPHYRPLSDLGIYGLAYKIAMLISFIYSSFQSYWSAQIFDILRRNDGDAVFSRIFSYVLAGLSFCALGLLVACRPVLQILASPAFQGAAAIVPLILAAYYVRAVGDFFRCLFLVVKRPALDAATNWLGALTCLLGYVLLIPPYGIWGAASATLIAFTVIGILSVAGTYRFYPYRVEKARLAKLVVSFAVPVAVYFLVPVTALPLQIVWGLALLGLFPLLLILMRFPTDTEKLLPMAGYRKALGWLGYPARPAA